ncbi:hypothetical protein H6A03_02105 [[Clostridium] spiroforme]|nr:hypothetical protein [Thomasclavelia spiroformis]MBM6879397.1 hypothetical protein [Thomasclavelia spiroformis]
MKCLKCGKEFEGDYCPNCGTKAEERSEVVLTQTHSDVQLKTIKKKPFYFRWWFFGIVVLIVACFDYFIFGFNKGEMIDWSTIRLNEVLPDPSLSNGEIKDNTKDYLSIIYSKSSMQEYNEYLNKCLEEGYEIDAEESESSYYAFNEDGYHLSLYYDEDEESLSIDLDAPIVMNEIEWPKSELGNILPMPESTYGNVNYEYSDSFSVYIGYTAKDEYAAYVNQCLDYGFNVDYSKGDDYFYAKNSDGWDLSVSYEGYNTMEITISAPVTDE